MKQKLNKLFFALLYLVPHSVIGNDLNHKYLSKSSYGLLYRDRQAAVNSRIKNFSETLSLSDVTILTNWTESSAELAKDVVYHHLEELPFEENADFTIVKLIRLLNNADAPEPLKEDIFQALTTIPFWLTKEDTLRVYWSENHMIMYLSSRFLLNERYGSQHFFPKDPQLRNKLLWWLQLKKENSFYEHNSHYLRYTLVALLNLYDYCQDEEVVELAQHVLDKLFDKYTRCLNSFGLCFAATSRGKLSHYSEHIKSRTEHLMAHLLLGTSLINATHNSTHIADAALVSTTYVPYKAAKKWELTVYEESTFGQSYESQQEWATKLENAYDRTVAGMTMGGYAHEDYIEGTLSLVHGLNIWNHKLFKTYRDFNFVPSMFYRSIGEFGVAFTAGSLLVSDYKFWRNRGSSLSSLENFFPGKKGYEQIPWIAGVGDTSVFTMSASTPRQRGIFEIDTMNNQLPNVHQEENVAVVLYYPNTDLKYIFSGELGVLLYFDEALFDRTKKLGAWVLGERLNQFVAVHKPCESASPTKKQHLFPCTQKAQAWVVVVGNVDTHESFNNFVEVVKAASVSADVRGRCIEASVDLNGKTVKNKMCEERGNIEKGIIICCLVLILLVFCIVLLRTKRRKTNETTEKVSIANEETVSL